MKTSLRTRDRHEDRMQREEKLGSPAETLPSKTLADRDRFASRVKRHEEDSRARSPSGPTRRHAAAGRRVSFRLKRPEAGAVFLAGTFNEWSPLALPLFRDELGDWSIDLLLGPGEYEYRFFVDGTWEDDPLASITVPNVFGSRNAVILVV